LNFEKSIDAAAHAKAFLLGAGGNYLLLADRVNQPIYFGLSVSFHNQ